MKQIMDVNTGVRLTRAQLEKLDRLATSLHTTRNRVFGMLLDAAVVEPPRTSVELKNNRHDAKALPEQNATAVVA